MDEEDQAGQNRDWIGEAILFVIGLWLIYNSNWNGLLIGIGSAFSLSPVLQIPAIRIYINKKTGQQIFSVKANQISDSTIIQNPRDVHIYQSPQTISRSAEHKKSGDDWEIDEEFSLEPGGYRYFDLELGVGDKLSGLVESDEDVSCYTLGPNSLQSFLDDDDFNPYWESEDVTRTKVSFKPKSGHKFFFVVYRDEDADEDVSVSVKLRTEK